MELIKFEEGKTYSTPSICDSECIFSVTVARRTDKSIFTAEGQRLKIHFYEGREQVKPYGNYSMAPVIDATDCEKPQTPAQAQTEAYTVKQANDIGEALAELMMAEAFIPQRTAKIYNLADYR